MTTLTEIITGNVTQYEIEYRIDENKLIIITAYEPNPLLWAENFSRRL